ncbi:hypothetical protein QJ48_01075 [Paenibacillus sp. A3]|uniref:hypothetical protein n=1 Tax=Paenibacillus sp. A3 TaxID=1337054 RepID=UPI0006D55E0B|nr:hypothetical protein [Paenibacillus sp. A3]KPV61223.1 hypothetical protein QJ48_01075 [Paenibacillus sp. A3]
MKWKEPTFDDTSVIKVLAAANGRRKADEYDYEEEQNKLNLTYPDWAKEWIKKYKEAWYIAEASSDVIAMQKAKELADALRDKLRQMTTIPEWAQQQMRKQTLRWMEANEVGNVRVMRFASEAEQGIEDKLKMIESMKEKWPDDAKTLNGLTAKWYYVDDNEFIPYEDREKYASPEAAKAEYTKQAREIIAKLEKPKQEEKKETVVEREGGGGNDWIPSSVLTYGGTSDEVKYFELREKNFKIRWNQDKINALWQASIEINKAYSIQIDPRFLLAIIIQEGTGSFNTSSTNRAADGQHGVEANYAVDLMKANSLMFGKILGYIFYGSDFRKAVANNNNLAGITGEGDIFQYANWKTPIVRMNSKKVEIGPYAGHGAWCEEVKKHYNALSGGLAESYEKYISSIDKSIAVKIVQDAKFNLPAYKFVAVAEAQNSRGVLNGEYIIKGVLV